MAEKQQKQSGKDQQPKGALRASLRRDTSAVPVGKNTLTVTVNSTIVDSWRGMVETFEIWGEKTCTPYVTRILNDANTFQRVAEFFGRRELARVLLDIIPVKAGKPTDVMIMKPKLLGRLLSCDNMDVSRAGVICDLVMPMLIKFGITTDAFKFSRHVRHGFKEVTIEDIKNDVMIYSLLDIAMSGGKSTIDQGTRYNMEVLCELLAEAVRPIGNAMLDVDNLSGVIDDMLVCVRAHLDPTGISGNFTGSVPMDWINNSNIEDLAHNAVFVQAALALPQGQSISVVNLRRLDRWCSVVVSAIKSSPRYRWVGGPEYMREIGLRKVRDVRGKVRSTVLFREMQVEPIAQSIRAMSDDFMAGATLVTATRDQIASTVQEAYGKARFRTSGAVDVFTSVLRAAIEQGWNGQQAVYSVWGDEHVDLNPVTLAMLMSDKLYIEVDESGRIIQDPDELALASAGALGEGKEAGPKWWFSVPTDELNIDILSGRHHQSRVITSDYLEVFLAYAEFEPREAVVPKSQVLGSAAFNTRMIDFNEKDVRSLDPRLVFEIQLNGVVMRGGLRGPEFSILRSKAHTCLVVPHFNKAVVDHFCSWLGATIQLVAKLEHDTAVPDVWAGSPAVVPDASWLNYLKRMPAHVVRSLASEISDHFRLHVKEAVIEKSIISMQISQEAADIMRARLQQRSFVAYAEVIALQFFLSMQGMESAIIDGVVGSEAMAAVCVERG